MTDADGKTPSQWELLRTMEQIRLSQERVEARMVTKDEFQVWQIGTDRRFNEVEQKISDVRATAASNNSSLAAKVEAESKRVDTEIEKVEKGALEALKAESTKREKLDDQQRDTRLRIWVGILLVAAGVVVPRILELM